MIGVGTKVMEDSAYLSNYESYEESYERNHLSSTSKLDNYRKHSKSYTSSSSLSSDESTILSTPTKQHVEVFCPNMHLGCQWSGSLGDMVIHTASDCSFTETICSLCRSSLPRNMMDNHIKSDCSLMPLSRDNKEMSVMPVLVMMQDFEEKRMNNERWCSPVLLTQKNGYHFRLKIDVNGWSSGDAIAVVVSLVKGDNDDELSWPFEGVITVQVLNQISNSSHSKVKHFVFCDGGLECQQVIDETLPEFGCWCDRFISHRSLEYSPSRHCQYLKDDCLFFLVSYSPLK